MGLSLYDRLMGLGAIHWGPFPLVHCWLATSSNTMKLTFMVAKQTKLLETYQQLPR